MCLCIDIMNSCFIVEAIKQTRGTKHIYAMTILEAILLFC